MRIVAALVIAGGALLTAAAAGALELGWGWAAAVLCLCAGVGLHAVAPSSRTMYVGALVRFVLRPRMLWPMRGLVVLTAPIAGAGPALYAALALAQAALLDPARSSSSPSGGGRSGPASPALPSSSPRTSSG